MSVLSSAESWLASMRSSYLSKQVALIRGANTTSDVSAMHGSSLVDVQQSDGLIVKTKTVDFIIPVSQYVFDGITEEPANGDRIELSDGRIFEAMDLGGEKCWRWHTRSATHYRIHCKCVNSTIAATEDATLLGGAEAWLNAMRADHLSINAILRRGAFETPSVEMMHGSTLVDFNTIDGLMIHSKIADFVIDRDKYLIDGDLATPSAGDQIELDDGRIYELVEVGDAVWRWHDRAGRSYRVHSRCVYFVPPDGGVTVPPTFDSTIATFDSVLYTFDMV